MPSLQELRTAIIADIRRAFGTYIINNIVTLFQCPACPTDPGTWAEWRLETEEGTLHVSVKIEVV